MFFSCLILSFFRFSIDAFHFLPVFFLVPMFPPFIRPSHIYLTIDFLFIVSFVFLLFFSNWYFSAIDWHSSLVAFGRLLPYCVSFVFASRLSSVILPSSSCRKMVLKWKLSSFTLSFVFDCHLSGQRVSIAGVKLDVCHSSLSFVIYCVFCLYLSSFRSAGVKGWRRIGCLSFFIVLCHLLSFVFVCHLFGQRVSIDGIEARTWSRQARNKEE